MLLTPSAINTWSEAIVKIALEENKVDAYIEQANALVDLLKDNDNLIGFLKINTTDSHDEFKANFIQDTFGKFDFDVYIINVLKILAERNKFDYVREIFKKVRRKLRGEMNFVDGTVWSTVPLSTEQLNLITDKIKKKIGKNLSLTNKIDPLLIGGVQVIVQGQVWDGSLKQKLDNLKQGLWSERE